jgi:hypothetical protein
LKGKLTLLAAILFCAALLIALLFCAPRAPIAPKEPVAPEPPKITLPFKAGEKFSYEVTFNGLKAGNIDFEYKGRQEDLDLVIVTNRINVLNIFQINSTESIYIDVYTCLPRRVEREVVFFGKQEYIIEEYNQKDGWVNVMQRKDGKINNKLIPQKPPIHNSHSLFFLYPLGLEDKIGSSLDFNLPLEKVNIRVKELRKVASADGEKEVFVLEVSPKKIILELDKEKRVPVRLEMPALWSKLVIRRR